MLIQDWMSTNIVSIAPSASLLKCVALLKEKGLRVIRIGDAVKSGTIANAVHSAYNVAVTV